MNDDDLIRRGDAIAALKAANLPFGYGQAAHAITNVPAALAASQPADPDGVLHDPDGHWGDFLRSAVQEAEKAMRKFPQPNYVISKVAEEAGEVVKSAIHAAEGRETLPNLRAEMRQLVAMLYRLWVEGDAVHGLPPVSSAIAASQPADPGTNAGCCQPVKVTPLVWEDGRNRLQMDNTMMMGKGYDFDTMELTRQEGYGLGCGYIIWAIRSGLGKRSWNVYGTMDGIFIQDIASEDAAKAAAQTDYEARILSALEPAPHVNEAPKIEHDNADVLTTIPAPVAPSLRITGPNSDGEYWLHIKAGGRSGGVNLGGEHGPIYKQLLDEASETGAKE